VLAHVTSLPGPCGIGDLGPDTVRFLDWAAEAGLKLWQLLPLGPAGLHGSPYSSPSAFAGNPLLISPQLLADAGWLAADALDHLPPFLEGKIDFFAVEAWKTELLRKSWSRFDRAVPLEVRWELEKFIEHPGQACWLEDWALYAALKERHRGLAWSDWDEELRRRRPSALREAGRELADEIAFHRYLQFLFHRQWSVLRRDARARGITLLGDVPFYVAPDSADIWSHQELFQLDDSGRPLRVGGVPPDYFSETGQLWGNPLYRWERIAERGYEWWIERIMTNLRMVDLLRLDHFRGFVSYWEVEADEETAVEGRWAPGPGIALFDALRGALGGLPFIAEDLGLITPDVEQFRRQLGLPGMRILQFAFGDPESTHLPEHHTEDCVVFTGTHDNDTLRGWFANLDERERRTVLEYLQAEPGGIAWRMIEAAYRSPARLALVPLQDLFDLGSEARMNRPGIAEGNWSWRARAAGFSLETASRLRSLAEKTVRMGTDLFLEPDLQD
jgi:4-alpha-glucanotransferase